MKQKEEKKYLYDKVIVHLPKGYQVDLISFAKTN